MQNVFYGRPLAWIADQIKQCQEDMASMSKMIEHNSPDLGVTRRTMGSLQMRFDQLWYAASQLDPVNYPTNNLRVRRTMPRYEFGS